MAAPIYCTHKELKRVFPQLDSFDGKKPIYGWTALFTHAGFSLYQGDNSGLVTDLFKDGQDLSSYQKTENYVDSTTNTDEAIDIIETQIDVVDGSVFAYGDIIKIDDEKMLITNIGGNTIIGGVDVQPMMGRTVYFDGCEFRHAVSNVLKGDRYTISSWYGEDVSLPLNKDFTNL